MAKRKVKKSSSIKKAYSKNKISEALAIVCLLLNIFILPGLGSLIGGKIKSGVWQLILFLGNIILGVLLIISIIGIIPGIILVIVGPVSAWIWGIVSGVNLIKESKK